MSLSLVEKFESIDIGLTDVITAHDERVCQFHQKQYEDALAVYTNVLKQFEELYSSYKANELDIKEGPISDWDDIRHMKNRIEKAKDHFVVEVCRHFEKDYQITVDRSFRDKYNTSITYQDIVHEILAQLNGLNFEEKAVMELKEKLVSCHYRVEVKKRVVHMKGFMYTEEGFSGNKRLHYSWREKVYCLTANLSHYEFGDTEPAFKYNDLMRELDMNKDKEESVFCKHLIIYDSVQSMTFRKNGKVEIGFSNETEAERFAKEYLGWDGAK